MSRLFLECLSVSRYLDSNIRESHIALRRHYLDGEYCWCRPTKALPELVYPVVVSTKGKATAAVVVCVLPTPSRTNGKETFYRSKRYSHL